jgi:hypothetical protein
MGGDLLSRPGGIRGGRRESRKGGRRWGTVIRYGLPAQEAEAPLPLGVLGAAVGVVVVVPAPGLAKRLAPAEGGAATEAVEVPAVAERTDAHRGTAAGAVVEAIIRLDHRLTAAELGQTVAGERYSPRGRASEPRFGRAQGAVAGRDPPEPLSVSPSAVRPSYSIAGSGCQGHARARPHRTAGSRCSGSPVDGAGLPRAVDGPPPP